jgi:SAM-dependent methyltransferase
MGLSWSGAKFVLSAMDMGMKLDSVCTLGRLSMFVSPAKLASLLSQHDRLPKDYWDVYPWRSATPMADPFFQLLGASRIDSMDNSDFEGASIVHDLNTPLPESLVEQYDLVFDGGTLEHVFHFPTAFENCLRMVKPGGHVILEKPANGLCGHGFYQLSPELFFRTFAPQYAFELVRLYLCVEGAVYHVVDPVLVHGRVELRKGSANLLVQARKMGHFTGFSVSPPQQSDYLSSWSSHEEKKSAPRQDGKLKGWLRDRLAPSTIEAVSKRLNRLRQRRSVGQWKRSALCSNRRFYIPVNRWDVTTRDATGDAFAARPAAAMSGDGT